jgi:predicted nucleotidyltransferase
MNPVEIQKRISPLFEHDPEVAAVYLFGSQATGKNDSKSDIDLAILFERRLSAIDSYKKLAKYFTGLVKALQSEPDLVDMENVNLILLFEILREGKVLIENNRERNREFVARKIVECIDFQYIVKKCAEGMYRHAMEDQSG